MRMEVSALLLKTPLVALPPAAEGHSVETGSDVNLAGTDACAALCTQDHGHFALVQRQATAALCLYLISELDEKAFPVTNGAGWRQLRDAVRSAIGMFERRVRARRRTGRSERGNEDEEDVQIWVHSDSEDGPGSDQDVI